MTAKCMPNNGNPLFWSARISGDPPCDGGDQACGSNCACCVKNGVVLETTDGVFDGKCMAGPGCTQYVKNCAPPILGSGTGAYCLDGGTNTCSEGAAYSNTPGNLGGQCFSTTAACSDCTSNSYGKCNKDQGTCTHLSSGLNVCLTAAQSAAAAAIPTCTGAGKTCYPDGIIAGTWSDCVYSVTNTGTVVKGDCVIESVRTQNDAPCGDGKFPAGNWACAGTKPDSTTEIPGNCDSGKCYEGTCKHANGKERKCAAAAPAATDFNHQGCNSPGTPGTTVTEKTDLKCANGEKCWEIDNPMCQAATSGGSWSGGSWSGGSTQTTAPVTTTTYTPEGCESDSKVTRICLPLAEVNAHLDPTGMYYVNAADGNKLYSEDWFKECTKTDTCCPEYKLCLARLDDILLCKSNETYERQCMTLNKSRQEQANGWLETGLPCHNDDSCCWRGVPICMERPKSEITSASFLLTIRPATTDKRIKTGCNLTANATQTSGNVSHSNVSLKVTRNGNVEIPVTLKASQTAAKPFFWTWKVPVESDGTYNFSIFIGSWMVNWTQFSALSSVPLSCPPDNCDELCRNNASFSPTKLGCGIAPCGKFQAKFSKTCTGGLCGTVNVSYCAEDPSCTPLVQGNWSTVNLGGTANFNVSMSANITGYSGTVNKTVFFIDGIKVGEDVSTPYSAVHGPYVASSAHIYRATAVTPDGNFSSVNYTVTVPSYIPTPTPTINTTNLTCLQYFECAASFSNCSVGTVYISSANVGSRIERKVNSSGGFSFYPPLAGTYAVQAVCGERASEVKTLLVNQTALAVSVVGGNCTIPDRKNCNLIVSADKPVPLDFFILGNASRGLVFSKIRREGLGWSGNRTISFNDIEYKGTGPHEISLFIYPRDAYLDVPGAFIKAVYVGKVQ